jgi:hypothetical protein
MSLYKYARLSVKDDEIRLLKLLPGQHSEDIEIEISHAPFLLDNMLEYEALSYVWGSPKDPRTINVRDTFEGSAVLAITRNLNVALRHLRRTDEYQVFWVDAICINQADIAERSNEVARMGDIFSKARQVTVWLGPKSEHNDLAMTRLQLIGADLNYDKAWNSLNVISGSETANLSLDPTALWAKEANWVAIKNILGREWFTRLWIVQEIALATQAVMAIGIRELQWEIF